MHGHIIEYFQHPIMKELFSQNNSTGMSFFLIFFILVRVGGISLETSISFFITFGGFETTPILANKEPVTSYLFDIRMSNK